MKLCELRAGLVAAALLALSACGDGGGAIITPPDDDDDPPASDCTATTCGEVRIALADADGDFLSYTVDVVSIRLEKANGDTVETLPTRQRVDFADLVDVTEFVTAASIPNGNYVAATLRLDYREAAVSVEVDGLPAAAEVVDANADPLEVVDVELTLDEATPVVIAPGTPALLQLDFDLEAAHEVNIGTTPVTVTAAPFLVASLEPVDSREFRVRGPLVSVNEAAGSYVVDLRPFYHRTARNGEFTVLTDADTTCEVDGDELDRTACVAALADLADDTLTAAHGVYDVADAHVHRGPRARGLQRAGRGRRHRDRRRGRAEPGRRHAAGRDDRAHGRRGRLRARQRRRDARAGHGRDPRRRQPDAAQHRRHLRRPARAGLRHGVELPTVNPTLDATLACACTARS